jgi:hypothetical protein
MEDETKITTRVFMARHGVQAHITKVTRRLNEAHGFVGSDRMNHWLCEFQHAGHRMLCNYSTGLGITGTPDGWQVLDCLARDCMSVEDARTFADWADEYGYEHDSRHAETVYDACKEQARALSEMLGQAYEELLYNVEHD